MKTLPLIPAAFLVLSASLSGTVLVSDDFSHGNRTIQDLPTRSAWFAPSNSDRLTASSANGGTLTINQANVASANTGAMTYFTPAGAPVTLSEGEILRVSFNFFVRGVLLDPDRNNTLWVGVFNSGGFANRLIEDGEVRDFQSSSANREMVHDKFEPYVGYMSRFNINRSSDRTDDNISRIFRRPLNDNNKLFTTAGAAGLGSVNPSTMNSLLLTDDTVYNFEYTIERLSGSNRITLTISGGDLDEPQFMTATDPSLVATAYDTFGIWQDRFNPSGVAFTNRMVLEDFEVSVIPEPRLTGAFLGLSVLALVSFLRRKRRN